jgi:predicted nucleic-acid-binding protein
VIALDTNILARLVTNDDPVQARQAAALIDSGEALFVPASVMLELEWVLRGAYGLEVVAIVRSFEALLSIRHLHFERRPELQQAVTRYASGMDFADALHHAAAVECRALLSFDRKFAQRVAKSGLLPPVLAPSQRLG